MHRSNRSIKASLLATIALVSLCGVAHSQQADFREPLDLSPTSIIHTVRNVIRLPGFLGGGSSVDSDVRFGRIDGPSDALMGVMNSFSSPQAPFPSNGGMRRFRESDVPFSGNSGPRTQMRSPPQHQGMHLRRPVHAMNMMSRMNDESLQNRDVPFNSANNSPQTEGVDEVDADVADFVGSTRQMINPIMG